MNETSNQNTASPLDINALDDETRALLERIYPDQNMSALQRAAFKHGYAKSLWSLIDRMDRPDFSIPMIITEAVQVLAHSICDNRYCAVFHSFNMIDLGYNEAEVLTILETQQLPERDQVLKRWETTLRLLAVHFQAPSTSNSLFAQLARHHNDQELEDLGVLIAYCNLDRFILEYFSDEIDLRSEPRIVKRASFTNDLLMSFTTFQGKKKPIVTLCSLCKSVQTEQGWIVIEEAIPKIPGNALFSHGYCPPCLQQTLAAEGLA